MSIDFEFFSFHQTAVPLIMSLKLRLSAYDLSLPPSVSAFTIRPNGFLLGKRNLHCMKRGAGSYRGTVTASGEWGGPITTMNVPAARRGSLEETLHRMGASNKILLSSELRQHESWMNTIGHRAIGVVYNPSQESGNYVPSVIPERYDAFIFFDQTRALRPLGTRPRSEPPDTYPSGY